MGEAIVSETIRVARYEDVATVTPTRPDRLNSFTTAMHEKRAGAPATIADDAGVRAVLLTGAGRGFRAGQVLADRALSPGRAAGAGAGVALACDVVIAARSTKVIQPFAKRPAMFTGR